MDKKHKLVEEENKIKELSIVGIKTSGRNIALIQAINSTLRIGLKLTKDFEVWDSEKERNKHFKIYYYNLADLNSHVIAIETTNRKGSHILGLKTNYDFFLVIAGRDNKSIANEYCDRLSNHSMLRELELLDPNDIKAIPNDSVNYNLFEDINLPSLSIENFRKDLYFYLNNHLSEQRVFIAYKVLINKDMFKVIERLNTELSPYIIRKLEPENMHITLAFLGNISNRHIQRLNRPIKKALGSIDSIDIEIDKLGYFEKNNQYIVWFGIKENSLLGSLINELYKELRKTNLFYCDSEAFIGHISIMYVRKGNYDIEKVIRDAFDIHTQKLRIENLTIFDSVYIDNYRKYNIIKIF